MRILGRLILLGIFAALGVGLALYVGFSTPPPSGDGPVPPHVGLSRNAPAAVRPAAEPGRSGVSPAADMPAAPRLRLRPEGPEALAGTGTLPRETEAVETADPGRRESEVRIPEGPVLAEIHPPRAYQVSSGASGSGLLKAFRFWTDVSASMLGQVGSNSTQPDAKAAPLSAPRPETSTAPDQSGALSKSLIRPAAPGEGDEALEIDIRDEDIRTVLETLGKHAGLNILASKSVQGTVSATLTGVDVHSALDAILKSTGYVARREGHFIYVGTPADFDMIEQSLDTVGTRVYRPNYVTAAELQQLIEPLVTPQTGVVSVSSPAEVGIGADATNAGGDAFAGGDVVVVRDYEAVLCQIDQVVDEIDARPLQVAIEAMILSVSLDDGNDFGLSFELLRDKDTIRLGWGTPLQSLVGPGFQFDDGGLKFGFLDSSLSVFLEALESVGDTNVIATPQLMVLNKHRAEILIGEELGYVSTTITETAASQSVEFLEVGAQLRLRPFISSDGIIRMEVHPELSSGSVDTESGFTLPNKQTTQVTTNIMVPDGCTVIIGGLIREEMQTTAEQVPFLGSLPLVGVAFRTKSEKLQRREILVLITPRIVCEPESCAEGERAACEFHRRQQLYAEKSSPWGKRHVGRKYFRLAQNAWAAGDRQAALRFAELSLHFDPLNRAAIDLRSSIWLGQRFGEHTLDGPAASLDGMVIAPWLLEDLQRQSPAEMQPLHPLPPGRPGRRVDVERPRSLQ